MAFLSCEDVKYAYGKYQVLNNISFNVAKPSNVAIIGNAGSGKTTLLKLINGSLFGSGKITVNDEVVNIVTLKDIKKKVSLILDDDIYVRNNVLELLKQPFTNLILKPSEVNNKLEEVIDYFNLEGIIEEDIDDLKVSDKYLIKIIAGIITKPDIVLLDDVIGYLTNDDKKLVFKYLKKEKINFVMVTSEMEEVINADYLVVLYNGSVAIEGNTLSVLKEEKILRRLGFNLPFYIDLSIQLGLYGVIDGTYLNKEDMVKAIWK